MKSLNIEELLARLSPALTLPRFGDMRARTRRLVGQRGVDVRAIGADRTGEPIEMISLGDGPRSVLVIGAPHPNEPVGCAAIEWLIEQLQTDVRLRERFGYRWHFVKAIEPYALQQNEAWFERRDPATYFRHYFRPPGEAQAEYAFPATSDAPTAWRSTPENEAYRQALQIAQPQLLVSLHNAEASGAFYFVNRNDAALASQLSNQALSHGFALHLDGEPGPDVRDAPLAPGVFLLQPADGASVAPRETPGRSVLDYLADQAGPTPMFLVPEVPIFVDRTVMPSFASVGACLESLSTLDWRTTLDMLFADHLPSLGTAPAPLEQLYLRGIDEGAEFARRTLDSLSSCASASGDDARAQARVRAELMLTLRPVAMMRRLAAMRAEREELQELARRARDCAAACDRALASALASPLLREAFEPVPLRSAVVTQIDAILATARAVAEE